MAVLAKPRAWLARAIAPPAPPRPPAQRTYAGALINRLTADWIASSTSFDAELKGSLRQLRNRARELVRDSEYAKSATRLIKNNVIGTGILLEAQVSKPRGALDERANGAIEDAWEAWSRKESCHAGGTLSMADLERLLIGAVVESGEVLVRKIRQPFGRDNRIPLALEVIEADQLVDDYNLARADSGNSVRMGVEVDQWQRPVAYYLYPFHPGDFSFRAAPPANRIVRVPADEIIHLYLPERPGATRGVTWFHSALQRMNHMRGYEEAEIVAARASACVMGFIQTPEPENPATADGVQDGERVTNLGAGEIKALGSGETFQGFNPTRPNPNLEGFIRYMLRALATAIGVPYEVLSADYSQSNYSSSRQALIESRDYWRVLQAWFVENFKQPVYEAWLQAAVLSNQVALPGYELAPGRFERQVTWKTRGWSWVDPQKEVEAAKSEIRSGLTTLTSALAERGVDIDDMIKQRVKERDLAKQYKLVFDSDAAEVDARGRGQLVEPEGAPTNPNAADGSAGDNAGGSDGGGN